MTTSLRGHMLALADAYEATGRRLGGLGHQINNDGKFFNRLRDGGGITTDTYERALVCFSESWPADTPWPDGVPRPHARSAA